MATYSAGLLNVGTLDATGDSATLQANTANVTTLTATTVNATNFNNPNLNVTGTSTVQGQQVALAAGGWNNLPTKTLPNTMRIVFQSCENTCGDIVQRKMKTVLNSNSTVFPNGAGNTVINGNTTFDQAMHEQMCAYVKSLNPDTFIHTGDSGYTDGVAAGGMEVLIFNEYSESYGALSTNLKTFLGYNAPSATPGAPSGTGSDNPGPFFNAMGERSQDNNSEMWLQSPGGQLLRDQVENRGGFHVIWDDHDAGSNNMGTAPTAEQYKTRQLYKNLVNGWGSKSIVDGYDVSGNVLTIESKFDSSGNPRFYYNGTLYNPEASPAVQPVGQVSTLYGSWDQQIDYNDNTGNKFKIRFIVMDDQHYDSTTGSTFVQDVQNPRGFSPIFYPDTPATGRAAVPYFPSDASGVRVNSYVADLSGYQGRYTDSSGRKFEYMGDPRYTETRNFFGDKQLNWAFGKILEAKNLNYDLIMVISGTPFWIEGYNQDSMSQYPYERQLFTSWIRENKVDNLVFFAGDTHFNYVSQKQNVAGYPILDIVSSGVSEGVGLTFQDGPSRDTVWGPDWYRADATQYRDPTTVAPTGTSTPSIWKGGNLFNANMYQFMSMDIILPGSVDPVKGDKYVDTSGKAITTPTIRLTQHFATNDGIQSLMGTVNVTTGIIAGVNAWKAAPNFYDINLNTLKHSTWVGQTITTNFNKNPVNPWKNNPCNDQIVKDASGNGGVSPLNDNMVPWNRTNTPTQVSSSPIMDISGNYLKDISGNFLQIPQDILCEILPVKHDVSGNFLDLSGNVITATCYIPQYTDTVNKYNFIVFDSSASAVAALTTDLSGYSYNQVCKYDASYNPYTPSIQTFTGGSGKVYHLAYDGSGVAYNHVKSDYYYIYGVATVDYTPTSYGLKSSIAPTGPIIAMGWNNLQANVMCPYVEDTTVPDQLNAWLKDASGTPGLSYFYVRDLSNAYINVTQAAGIIGNYYASLITNTANYGFIPLSANPGGLNPAGATIVAAMPGNYVTLNRKYFVTVTRDPSGLNVTTAPTRTFQLPLNMRNTNPNFHGAQFSGKDLEVWGKGSAPVPYVYGFGFDTIGVESDQQCSYGMWAKPSNFTDNNGCGNLQWVDGYGFQQHEKTLGAICGAAGYVGESPTFTFYSTDASGLNRYELGRKTYKLKFKNNTVFTNVPGNNQFNYSAYQDAYYLDAVEAQANTISNIFYNLGYQQFQNVMRRMAYGTENLGKNMITWPGVKVCNALGVDAVDANGLYTVLFTNATGLVDWDISVDSSGNPLNTLGAIITFPFTGLPILQHFSTYVAPVPAAAAVKVTTSGTSSGYTDVKIPLNQIQYFRTVRYTGVGTSTKMTNLWYEYNSFINALHTVKVGYTDASFNVFDGAGGFGPKYISMTPVFPSITPITGPAAFGLNPSSTLLPMPVPGVFLSRIINTYGSMAYTRGGIPRSLFDIYRLFNEKYYSIFTTILGTGAKTKNQIASNILGVTTN